MQPARPGAILDLPADPCWGGTQIANPLALFASVCVKSLQSGLTLPGSSVHGDSPGKNSGVGCHVLLQGICATQGKNPGLPHCRQILDRLSRLPYFQLALVM